MLFRKKHKSDFILLNDHRPVWLEAVRIAGYYILFGFAWIFLSDHLASAIFRSPQLLTQVNILKGFIFVVLSALFIYSLIGPALTRLSDTRQTLLEKQEELKTLVYYDHLTGLSNRRYLYEHLPAFVQDPKRTGKALLYIDMDHIKFVNDSLGHQTGDSLIRETAKRIRAVLPPQDELSHLGADEFVAMVGFDRPDELRAKTALILEAFSKPLHTDSLDLHTSLSIGVALYPEHGQNTDELLQCADIAMFESKRRGRNRSSMFDQIMMDPIHRRMRIGEQLHSALENTEFTLMYQPQIDIKTGTVVSFEALLRWKNPVLGFVSPADFIPVAEETRQIIPIGCWVLEHACIFLAGLRKKGNRDLIMAVNISAIQLMQDDFVPVVLGILKKTSVPPENLEIEITESVMMESFDAVSGKLNYLRALGVGVALDDFGQGYSSLSYLNRLPISVLKIDKVFVDAIGGDGEDHAITGDIVRIGKKLGLNIVAEGVEKRSQVDYLLAQGCDKIQGYFYSKPLTEDDAAAYVQEQNLRS